MKLNEKSLGKFATSGAPPDKEGYMHKRGDFNKGYQKRWFVLKGNLLFYYERRGEKEPIGVIVLEGCTVELSDDSDGFTFMIHFPGSHCRTYYLCADTQEEMEAWMKVLSCASYDYMKMCVSELQSQLQDLNSSTNQKLIQSASRDNESLSSQLSHLSSNAHSSSHETDSGNNVLRRHNPFDTDDEFDRDSFVMDHYADSKKARSFLEMHEDFGRQIKEIMEAYMSSQNNSLLLGHDTVV